MTRERRKRVGEEEYMGISGIRIKGGIYISGGKMANRTERLKM